MSSATALFPSPVAALVVRARAGLRRLSTVRLPAGPSGVRRLIAFVEVLLVIVCADQTVRIAWRIISPPSLGPEVVPSGGAVSTPFGGRTGLPLAAKIDLFAPKLGSAAPPSDMAAATAPDTNLNLKLVGARAENDKERGSAIVQRPDGTQDVFFPGQTIIDGVTLDRVLADRVVIRRNGLAESLRFDQTPVLTQAPSDSETRSLYPETNPTDLRTLLAGIETSVAPDGGVILNFAQQSAAFNAIGLVRGDIIRAINGQQITSMAELMAAVVRIAPGHAVTFEVDRDGDRLTKTIGGSP